MSGTADLSIDQAETDTRRRSEALRERIYVTFTALAVAIAFERDVPRTSASAAAITLSLTVFGTLLTVFVADVVAHIIRVSSLPSRAEMAHLLHASFANRWHQ